MNCQIPRQHNITREVLALNYKSTEKDLEATKRAAMKTHKLWYPHDNEFDIRGLFYVAYPPLCAPCGKRGPSTIEECLEEADCVGEQARYDVVVRGWEKS